jgi:hypothetical protein
MGNKQHRTLIALTPIERLKYTVNINEQGKDIISSMIELYEWFLEITADDSQNIHNWIGDDSNQKIVSNNAEEFHDLFYNLIELTSKDLLKFYTL